MPLEPDRDLAVARATISGSCPVGGACGPTGGAGSPARARGRPRRDRGPIPGFRGPTATLGLRWSAHRATARSAAAFITTAS